MNEKIVSIEKAIEILNNGGVGVMPTDTVYGLVARAEDITAVTRLYALKHREHKPGTLIASSVEQLQKLGVKREDLAKVARWWPGPLSAVLDIEREYLHQGLGDAAMRVVSDMAVRVVLEDTGPLMTSSANQPGEPGSTTIQEAIDYFGDRVDFYVDGGNLSDRTPSTIVKPAKDGTLAILRQGALILKQQM